MRLGALIIAAIVVSEACLLAQEKPLGDVAREARAQKAQPSQPAKVLTNDDMNAGASGSPVAATDNPLSVVTKAADALKLDTSHRCREESSDIGDPGWARVSEVAGPGRIHFIEDEFRPPTTHGEIIVVDKDAYSRNGSAPWEKMKWDFRQAVFLENSMIPLELKFGYNDGDLKLIRTEVINGSKTYLYQSYVNTIEIDRTISIWIGVNDNLFRKAEMITLEKSGGTSWTESASCSYGLSLTIERPI